MLCEKALYSKLLFFKKSVKFLLGSIISLFAGFQPQNDLNFYYTFLSVKGVNYTCNLGQNIWRLFHILAKFVFTTSETELDYYHQKVNVRVVSQVAERLKT